MNPLSRRDLSPILGVVVLVAGGCGERAAPREPAALPAAYADTVSEFPRLQYADGELSLNDRCPVRKAKLNTRLSPLYVNGRPIGFC
jgi:hypothetical protein